jgi:signal transduction histidine kinase/ActR/RegA family two-component response regulator
MLTHIRKWLAPPVFEGDEDKTRTARILNKLLVSIMLFLIFTGGILVPFVFIEKLPSFGLVLGMFGAMAVAHWQMRRGRVRLASTIWVSATWIIFTILVSLAGGMTSISAVFYVAGTVIAGLLLGTRAALTYTLLCSLAGLGMLILESSNHPLPRLFPVPVIVGWVIMTFALMLAAVVLNHVLRSLNEALALARRQVEERKQAEEALRESNRRLETTLAELKDAQGQMVHQERLAAVGQLAAGIAHDFNNILATIVLYTQMSLRSADLSPKVHHRLEIIAQETGRAADLVQQILDFSRRTMLERRPVALDSFMKEVIKLLQRTLPESIQIDLTCEPALSSVEGSGEYVINADLTRIQQTIVNLALNARDAMPGGGEIHITLSRIADQEIQCVGCGPVFGGEWIQVAVTDTGTGIAPAVLPRIFEPFFTTRAPLGHGLGLSQVYGIVKQHKGHIGVETEVGQGTTFRLYWPAPATTPLPVEAEALAEVIQGHGETILVVEDNATMRASLADALEMLNYQVLEATDGQNALSVREQHADEIALVLSDWVMPSMDGLELTRALTSLHPELNVLLFTGHPLSQEIKDAVPPNVVGWLLKPPSLEQLAKAVSQALSKGNE